MSSPKKKDLLASGLSQLRSRSGQTRADGGFMAVLAAEIAEEEKADYTEEDAQKIRAIAIRRGLNVQMEHRDGNGYVAVMSLEDFYHLLWFVEMFGDEIEELSGLH